MAAEDAVVMDDIGPVARKADGLDRAVPDAFIAVLAVGLVESKAFHSFLPIPFEWFPV